MDYITLNGIRDRTGFDGEDLYQFVIKELLDNAVDDLEKKYTATRTTNNDIPQVRVSISADCKTSGSDGKNYKYLKLKVQNSTVITSTSNDDDRPVITLEMLHSIFSFDSFFSSKRNQYKITRGALGDALKEVICIPYAMSKEYYNIEWNEPLIISSGKQRFFITLDVDRFNQKIDAQITQDENNSFNSTVVRDRKKIQQKYTEVEIHIPVINRADPDFVKKLESFLVNYAIFNTHIAFHYEISEKDDDINNNNKPFVYDLPQLQKINTNWKNIRSSIHYYAYHEFEHFILVFKITIRLPMMHFRYSGNAAT